ncbi:helix-turn-helix transcriptional regulator [Natrinema salsiterrestre]|uniref:MarR family transcriptional regulator n=1 Tax=Natrinema salsiterrestre TaxID=2950540 RepID=A0A9Q4Q0H1_9EURY|nr:MarR family transcriptional regulator [Natrinema salsiterrestre]MDF9744211.1 MarR family transcriptional regulator [Natrinema salsiterrestre]
MNRRHSPFPIELGTAVERTIRSCIGAIGAISADPRADDASGGARSDSGPTGTARRASSDTAARGPISESDDDRSMTTGLVDPDDGPTSRRAIFEHGFTPEEYVRAVLLEHGGRIKQRRFADRYGWSDATLSRLLSELEDGEAIERYRVGREKVVCLPAALPESVR